MTYAPHSLLEAAKLTADVADLEWSVAQRFYRTLQGVGRPEGTNTWLPKSQGRNIWYAHPHYISRLLIAIGMTASPDQALDAVNAVLPLTPEGRDRGITETDQSLVEMALTQLLIHEDQAADVDRVEFDPVKVTVSIIFKSGTVTYFCGPKSDQPHRIGSIYRCGVIPGEVLAGLARSINWRRYCDSPLGIADSDQASDEE